MLHQELIARELRARTERNVRYSARAFARSLGLHPSSLCRILQGKQSLSARSCFNVLEALNLSQEERDGFVRSLVEHSATRRQEKLLPLAH
jgi:transcriptional regulator with XRE-family HTH domain